MQPLDRSLRKEKLEPTVKVAREVAEAGARAALEQLGVREAAPYVHLTNAERELHQKLRAHGRQLGDPRNVETGAQAVDLLAEEVAYQHWHRMLFARFLAENNLLMYPDSDQPVPVTLEECAELAAEEGAENGWELAARFAARMLPQVFRPDSPLFGLRLPPEHELKLERLVAGLPREVFIASDSVGWVYQFWQAKRKDEVNASEVKIGARELPAVTQLFTEPYMVAFLLDNSLGAWWAARRLSQNDLQMAESEEELRAKAALPGVHLEYLRFVKETDGAWTPAAGTFDAWPGSLGELKLLDPCCGSGHFLVAALLMLVPMRMALEGLSARQAVEAVLRDNIHGLEIDRRCVELAAFALALAAWRYPEAGGYRPLPELHLACSGLSPSVAKEEWRQLALNKPALRTAMDWMYDSFLNAPVTGSLLNPAKSDAAKLVEWEELSRALDEALRKESTENTERTEMGIAAQGLAKAAMLLAGKYHLVVTNVPYLMRGKQSDTLRDYCERQYPAAKNDLATVFLDRCLEFCREGGVVSLVLPQNWLFLTSYRKFREKLLKKDTWHLIARLGPGAFETISGEVVKAILIILSRGHEATQRGELPFQAQGNQYHRRTIAGIEASEPRTAAEKAALLVSAEIKGVEQAKQLENPDARVTLEESGESELLARYADGLNGMHGADSPRFRLGFWEVADHDKWHFLQCTHTKTEHFGGRGHAFYWDNNGRIHRENPNAYVKGEAVWGKLGVVVSMMRELPATLYSGNKFDISCTPIVPHNPAHLPAIWCFCSSPGYAEAVRQIDQSLKVTNATLVKVPFDLEYWTEVSAREYPNGLPEPYSDDPTQWIFHGHPCGSVIWNEKTKWLDCGPLRTDNTVLQVAVTRLLGYRWPAELDSAMELAGEARAWVKKSDALLAYADRDGIVCLPPVRGEASATDRLLNLLAAAYGDAWSGDVLSELLKRADHAGKTLETWLRDKFFSQHCQLFHHRPFIWHIWDGLRDGFAALVSYHRLDARLLERLVYTYLGDWINRQKQDSARGIDGAGERLAAGEVLKKRLELILEGEQPYDIFIRWKPIGKQPIGWNPDLNDGVRLNIRPFLSVPDVGKRGAGVLRDRPNVNWEKDRGKDVPSAPWYHLFKGDRINDYHLSLAEKKAAREVAKKGE
ncbi:MAG: N-6 DNA methylase [Chloroflexi bacterium]|nr:N-6 DNA methylase [Chloroflexota bacterium]